MLYILLGHSLAYSTKYYKIKLDKSNKGNKPKLKEEKESKKSTSKYSYLFITNI